MLLGWLRLKRPCPAGSALVRGSNKAMKGKAHMPAHSSSSRPAAHSENEKIV